MLQNNPKKSEKIRKIYSCETCEYITSNKKDYNKHCSTKKHKDVTNVTTVKSDEKDTLVCSHCDKKYTSRMGLWRHSKICKPAEKENISMVLDDDVANLPIQNYIIKLLEQNKLLVDQNQDFKQTMLELRRCILIKK